MKLACAARRTATRTCVKEHRPSTERHSNTAEHIAAWAVRSASRRVRIFSITLHDGIAHMCSSGRPRWIASSVFASSFCRWHQCSSATLLGTALFPSRALCRRSSPHMMHAASPATPTGRDMGQRFLADDPNVAQCSLDARTTICGCPRQSLDTG